MLIDEYLPQYQFEASYDTEINAPVERVYPVVRKLDLRGAYLLRLLFWLRSIPGKLAGKNPLGPTLADLERAGLSILDEAPPLEFVTGFAGKIWTPAGGIRKLSATEFRDFSDPELAKIVWSFSLEPLEGNRTHLTTHTRIQCDDPQSLKKFRRYAAYMSAISGMTRKSALRCIKRQAEALSP
jgi:hypothetical protein